MEKVAIIFWSQTGNTEEMANAIKSGIKNSGGEVNLFNVSEVDKSIVAEYNKLILGCPSMGNEVLEEDEFEPFFAEIKSSLSGKKIALFGSYDWGDGEWMRNWEEETKSAGANLFKNEGLILNLTPDEAGIKACNEFGKEFLAY